jgi:hypothetical protein
MRKETPHSLSLKDRQLYADYGLGSTIKKVIGGKLKPGLYACLIVDEQTHELRQVGAFIEADGFCSVQPWESSTDVSL